MGHTPEQAEWPASKRRFTLVVVTGLVLVLSFNAFMILLPKIPRPELPPPVSNLTAGALGSDLYLFHLTTRRKNGVSTESWVRKKFRDDEQMYEDPSFPVQDLAEFQGRLWLFNEGEYHTFDGKTPFRFQVPWAAGRSAVASDGETIFVLTRGKDDFLLTAYTRGRWQESVPVRLGGEAAARSCPEGCSFDFVSFKDRLHFFWIRDRVLYHEAAGALGSEDSGKARELAPAKDFELLSTPDELLLWFLSARETPRPGFQAVDMMRFDGQAWSGGPSIERPNPASHLELSAVFLQDRARLLINNVIRVEALDWEKTGYGPSKILAGEEVGALIIRYMSSLFIVSLLIMTGMSGVLSFFMNRWKHQGAQDQIKGGSRPGTAVAYASVWERFLAKAIDTVGVGLPVGALVWSRTDPAAFLFMGTAVDFFSTGGRAFVLVPLALALYHIICEGLWGRTAGKRLLGIRVTGKDGEGFGMGRSALRNLFRLLDGLYFYGIGLVSIAATERWQRVGDLIGRTIVVKDQER